MELISLDRAQTRILWHERMKRDFPKMELKKLQTILRLQESETYDVLGVYDDGMLMGYAAVYHPPKGRVYLLDYLAVEPDVRGRGLGTEILKLLQMHYKDCADCLIIECERPKAAPDEQLARRRIRFYERAGAVLTNTRFWLFRVEYSILVLPCTQVEEDRNWADEMLSLYRQMLAPEVFAQNVRLIRA